MKKLLLFSPILIVCLSSSLLWAQEKPKTTHKAKEFGNVDITPNLETEDEIIETIIDYIHAHQDIWNDLTGGLSFDNFTLNYSKIVPAPTGKMAYVQFNQFKEQKRVEGAYVNFTLKILPNEETAIIFSISKTFPNINLPTRKFVHSNTLKATAAENLNLSSNFVIDKDGYSIQYLGNEHEKPRWRRVYEISSFENPGIFAYIDQDTGEFIQRVDKRHYIAYTSVGIEGIVQGRGVEFDPMATGDVLDILNLPDLLVSTEKQGIAYTNHLGAFSFPFVQELTHIMGTLSGRWANVISEVVPTLEFLELATPGIPVNIMFNPYDNDEYLTAQVNAYYHTTFIHNYLQDIFMGSLPEIDIPLTVNVNIDHNECLPYYYDLELNLAISGDTWPNICVNSAYDTVIYHEYGHYVDEMAGGSSGIFSDGWGDLFGCYASYQPIIGVNFRPPKRRTCDNGARHFLPEQEGMEDFFAESWVGFTWHLRENLINTNGEENGIAIAENLVIPIVLANPPDGPTAVMETLLRDDNDDDLTNGTPHFSEIVEAANRHDFLISENESVANFSIPQSGYVLPAQASMDIIGTADTTSVNMPFVSYQLFYGIGRRPVDWIPINEPQTDSVVDGILGSWNISGLPYGEYSLKLVVDTGVLPDGRFRYILPSYITNNIPQKITVNEASQFDPQIYSDYIVYADVRDGLENIYLFDLSTGDELQITTNPEDARNPQIFKNYIVWEDYRDCAAYPDIYAYNILTGNEVRITDTCDNLHYNSNPAIFDHYIVYQDSWSAFPIFYDIRLYDINTGESILLNDHPGEREGHFPDIHGNHVVWVDERDDGNSSTNSFLYLYDIDEGTSERITFNSTGVYTPAIHNNYIVWKNVRTGEPISILMYDINTGQEINLTGEASSNPHHPDIHGDFVVWEIEGWQDYIVGDHLLLYQISTQQQWEVRLFPNKSRTATK